MAAVDIKEFTQPTDLFTYPDKLNPMYLADDKTTPTESHQENGALPPHVTQPYSQNSPLTDASVATNEPMLLPRVDNSDTTYLAITYDHPEVRLKAANNALFHVYENWEHQNPGTRLDSGIKEDRKCKYR